MTTELVLVILIFFAANLVNAITGFAGVLLAMPPTILLLGVDDAKVICTAAYQISCVILALMTWRQANFKETVRMAALMIPGLCAGVALYYTVNLDLLMLFYGILIVVVALRELFLPKRDRPLSRLAAVCILIGAGMMQGLFISGGALAVIYALQKFRGKEEFRASLTLLWVLLNTLMLGQEWAVGTLTAGNVTQAAAVIPAALIGIWIGNKLMRRLSGAAFFRLAGILLLISGISCFFK